MVQWVRHPLFPNFNNFLFIITRILKKLLVFIDKSTLLESTLLRIYFFGIYSFGIYSFKTLNNSWATANNYIITKTIFFLWNTSLKNSILESSIFWIISFYRLSTFLLYSFFTQILINSERKLNNPYSLLFFLFKFLNFVLALAGRLRRKPYISALSSVKRVWIKREPHPTNQLQQFGVTEGYRLVVKLVAFAGFFLVVRH
ncbi:hypothetical protein H8356DRAFT_1395336 [Neocallimastix lanati (nom. inval.)]|nr:hypothetical protein H8356DRAFT_1395336 [Neocallimastix sp. JGI-2020a]